MATLTVARINQYLAGAFGGRARSALHALFADLATNPVDVTSSTFTVLPEYANRPITLNRAAGIAVTLPAATGSGAKFTLFVGTTITSNTTTITASGTDKYQGYALAFQDDAAAVGGWGAVAGTSTIFTMDGTTRGGYAGDAVTFTDVALGRWQVAFTGKQTGTEATPFS